MTFLVKYKDYDFFQYIYTETFFSLCLDYTCTLALWARHTAIEDLVISDLVIGTCL